VPTVDGTHTFLTIDRVQITAKIAATGAMEASITGLISEAEVDNKILPAVARWSTAVIDGRLPNPFNDLATEYIKGLMDEDGLT
jgi:hypothetical protein